MSQGNIPERCLTVCQTDGFQGTACDEYVNLNLEKDSA